MSFIGINLTVYNTTSAVILCYTYLTTLTVLMYTCTLILPLTEVFKVLMLVYSAQNGFECCVCENKGQSHHNLNKL